jgi:octaprenyl-diphosphate synthase
MPGKYLRPALVLLSAKAVRENPPEELQKLLLRTAAGVELIHNASLVHDDILDNDLDRRGQQTLNGAWGNKIALLAGDALYSRAFGILTQSLSKELLQRVVQLNEKMCSAEIEQARANDKNISRDEYFSIIEGKTALFMSLCCRLGPSLVNADEQDILNLEKFGLYFGLAYQLFDDNTDNDLHCDEIDGFTEALKYIIMATETIKNLPATTGREKLIELSQYLITINQSRK